MLSRTPFSSDDLNSISISTCLPTSKSFSVELESNYKIVKFSSNRKLTVDGISVAGEIRSLLDFREALTQIVMILRQVLHHTVDVESPDAASEVFLLSKNVLMQFRWLLRQTADEQMIRHEEFSRNLNDGTIEKFAWILSISVNADGRDVILRLDGDVMPVSIVDARRQ